MGGTMSLFDRIRSWWSRDAVNYTHVFVADGASSFVPFQSYLRVWVTESFLAKARERFTDRFPSLQTSVQLAFAGSDGATFSSLVRAGDAMRGPGVVRDHKVTELLPFAGGTVSLQAALIDIE